MPRTKEAKALYQKEWMAKNPGYHKQWGLKNPDRKTAKRLKWVYGITLEQYNDMLIAQGEMCKICKTPHHALKKKLSVDHCHATNKIRGLLCDLCNRALGFFKDNPQLLIEASLYLINSREKN